jgi:hypothetical protein
MTIIPGSPAPSALILCSTGARENEAAIICSGFSQIQLIVEVAVCVKK